MSIERVLEYARQLKTEQDIELRVQFFEVYVRLYRTLKIYEIYNETFFFHTE